MRFYWPIQKLDHEQHMVWGYASTEAEDEQGEVIRRDALAAALEDYMRFANIREMHSPRRLASPRRLRSTIRGSISAPASSIMTRGRRSWPVFIRVSRSAAMSPRAIPPTATSSSALH